MTTSATSPASAVARLNDDFRRHPGKGWMITIGVQAKGPVFELAAVSGVRSFTAFTTDNNPYGEHDFGSFELAGERLLWKIDYYDGNMQFGSPDPADPNVTCRVLTIMLASEY